MFTLEQDGHSNTGEDRTVTAFVDSTVDNLESLLLDSVTNQTPPRGDFIFYKQLAINLMTFYERGEQG